MNDVKNVWQNQARELQNVSLSQLREQLRHLHRKIRLQTALKSGIGLIILDFFVRGFLSARDLIERIGWGLPIVGSLCLVVPLIYENHKMMRSGNLSFNSRIDDLFEFLSANTGTPTHHRPSVAFWSRDDAFAGRSRGAFG